MWYNVLMDEVASYAVGLDVGTENVRAVVLSMNREGAMSVVGYGEAPNGGMRKGWWRFGGAGRSD